MASPMTSPSAAYNTAVASPTEQLHLPIPEKGGGITPLRLLEPIASLNLTPFAAKAARGIGVATVGELAAFVFDPSKECRGLGQGHLEEIHRKIDQFVGKPPYGREQHLDIPSLLRLSLGEIDASERAIIITRCDLQKVIPLSSQESREAEMVLGKEKDRKFLQIVEKARQKTSEKIASLLEMIFHGFLEPWMAQRGGVAHESEIMACLFEAHITVSHHLLESKEPDTLSTTWEEYRLMDTSLRLLQLLTNTDFLFARSLCHVAGKIWAVTPQEQARTMAILQDADMLIGKGEEKVSLQALAQAVEECRFEQWDGCSRASIQRLLFWHYTQTS